MRKPAIPVALFDPAFDSCDAPDAARLGRLAASLPAPLAGLLRDELAAGNAVLAIESGHPAPPVGVCVVFERPLATLARQAAEALHTRGLVRRQWPHSRRPVGWTDVRGHCFLLEPAVEAAAAPEPRPVDPPAQDQDLALRARLRAGPSEAMKAWDDSRAMTWERWHEGTGYDLAALARMTACERESVQTSLLHGLRDWRDVQALAALDTPRARSALRRTLVQGDVVLRMAVLQHAPQVAAEAGDEVRCAALVQALEQAEFYGGLSQALDAVEAFHPPAVMDALWRGLEVREAGVAVHFAALLSFLHGAAGSRFDWAQRPFFLRLHTDDPGARAAAVAALRRRLALAADTRDTRIRDTRRRAP